MPPHKLVLLILLRALIAAVSAATAVALPDDRRQPINLEADNASFDQRSGESVYRGNVVLTQGSMRVSADLAKVTLTAGKLQKMEASGAPIQFSYQPSADRPPIQGQGKQVVFNATDNTVIVSGDAKFTQGQDVFRGEKITYDLARDIVNAQGGGDSGRVIITLQPQTLEQ